MRLSKTRLEKARIKELKGIKDKFSLPYDPKTIHGYLWLSVFETGMKNKARIEACYEAVRNQCFDMWDYLSFNERNDLINVDLSKILLDLNHFDTEETTVYIPFFDELMNTLYAKEVAILELPQFFSLYHDYKAKLINMHDYGLLPLRANMSDFRCVYATQDCVILHNDKGHAFIKAQAQVETVYPYLKNKDLDPNTLVDLAQALITDESEFYQGLIAQNALSKREIKKKVKP